jgi:NAD-dependent dihydropyrimidine dehydrogenase PreA subunit
VCEFCHEHGEGKKWYLQMKNYARELLDAELSGKQKRITGVSTRREWMGRFMSGFVLGSSGRSDASPARMPTKPPSEAELVARQQVEHFGQVLPIEDVEAVIDMVDSITRMPCGCRLATTGNAKARYCFGVGLDQWGLLGKYPDGTFEVLEKSEARKLFRKFDREGLMHSIWTGVTPYTIGICNCDHDCSAYRHSIENRGHSTFFRAEYVADVNPDECKGCKQCMQQCQFGAMFYSSVQSKVYIHPMYCYGCGVCRAACSKDAIKLLPREKHPKAAKLWLK